MKKSIKKLFALPIIWLVLGAVSIATEIKTTTIVPPGQALSGAVVHCIQTALDTRETSIISATTTYQSNSLTALITRKTALLAAYDKSTKSEVKTAITAAWKNYKTSMVDSKATLYTAKKNTWVTYKTAVKTCKWTSLAQGVDSSSVNSEQ